MESDGGSCEGAGEGYEVKAVRTGEQDNRAVLSTSSNSLGGGVNVNIVS